MKTTSGRRTGADDLVPSGALLDTWSAHGWSDGVLVNRLAAFDRLTIRTHHSVYELIVVQPENTEVLIRGGAFFPEFARARVAGSSLGGSFLKLYGIYPGFRMELSDGERMVVTSPVREIKRVDQIDGGAPADGVPAARLM